MAHGVSRNQLIDYVLEADRELPKEQRTIFWIRPQTGHDANFRTKQYLRAYTEKDTGLRDLDIAKADNADSASFRNAVKKVENFAFSKEYYEIHPTIKEKASKVKIDGKDVLYTSVIDSEDMVGDVCGELESESLREIMTSSNSISKLREGQKK